MIISITQQVQAVEISAVNLRGHLDNLTHLVSRGRRNQLEIDAVADRLPALEAAVKTLRWLEQNEPKIKGRVA